MLHRLSLPGTLRAGVVAALLAAACAGPVIAADAPAFQKALKAQNANHLAEVLPSQSGSLGTIVEGFYSDKGAKGPWEYRVGDLAVSVEIERSAPIDLSQFPVPVLSVSVGGKMLHAVEGAQGAADFAAFLFQIVELDPDNKYPEIVFSNYTGGAHCCSDTVVLTGGKDGRTWRTVEMGQFDGDLISASDLDGDARYEFAVRDNRFLYRFGCYACSTAPLRILQLQGDRIADVSADKAYRDAHAISLARMVKLYSGGSEESNGFLAGYVGQKIRLGEGGEAWDFMMKHHDRKSDWGTVECSKPLNDKGECPGKTITHTFPEALKRFLVESGYPVPE